MLTQEEQDKINAGSIATAAINNTISSSSLKPIQSIPLPDKPADPNYAGISAGATTGATTPTTAQDKWALDLKGAYATTPTNESFGEKIKKYLPDFMVGQPTSEVDKYKEMISDPTYIAKQKEVDDLSAQIAAVDAEANTQNLKLEDNAVKGGDVSSGFLSRQQQEVNRQAAIKKLPLTAQLNAANGRLGAAQDNINTMMSLIEKDQANKYKYQTDLIDWAMTFADKDQQAELQKKKDELQATKDKQDAFNTRRNSAVTAAMNEKDYATAAKLAGATTDRELQALMPTIKVKPATQTQTEKDQVVINSLNNQLVGAKGTDGYTDPNLYARLRASSSISASDFDNRFGYLVNPASYAKLGISKGNAGVPTYSSEQIKQLIYQQMGTATWKTASTADKQAYIYSLGANPADFGL